MINRILLLSVLIVCFATTVFAQNYTEFNLLINYEGLSSNEVITTETESMLSLLLENASKEAKIVRVELTAHAENRNIGEKRLEPYVQFFEKQGIRSPQLELTTQVDDENQVHIKIISTTTQVPTPLLKEDALTEEQNAPIKKVYCAGASKKAEVFSIAPGSNIVIKGKEGTEVNISRRDLIYEDGSAVQEPITVELKEFYTPQDILLAELHTMEGDKVLETGGMLNLKITAQGKPLGLKTGRSANIKMSTKSAKTKKGMNLYFGKRLANGAVDWRLQERPTATKTTAFNSRTNTDANAEFNPGSYIQLKKTSVIDSVTSRLKVHVKAKNVASNNYPNYSRERVVHSHEEEYLDLELPYLNPNIVDGVWINADQRIQDPFAPKPVEVMVQVQGIPNQGVTADGELIAYTPRVALMLKSRAVFLRGNMVSKKSFIQEQNIQFSDVPRNEEVVLVAFLDTGKELLFASKEVTAIKDMEMPILKMEAMSKVEFNNTMASIAN